MSVNPNLVGSYLESKLKSRPYKTVTYGEISAKFGLPNFNGAWAAHPLSQIFEVLDQQDANANRPFRTSVVIAIHNNAPGPGLYEALERLKFIPDPKTKIAREQLWLSELKAAYIYSWP
ncbi:MAG: hypothetical protein PHX60_06840 [Giesbergeria sp.]|uniref:hypothetical protein n=1 Tax=Giesbergeria sp. TaxID=2818473 RepID=UPI002613133F|nr:hypothetical protein [Giesbergeria sp.]MDD2609401.1 hypothetical protein [Giesbergeria sp.]